MLGSLLTEAAAAAAKWRWAIIAAADAPWAAADGESWYGDPGPIGGNSEGQDNRLRKCVSQKPDGSLVIWTDELEFQ